MIKETKKITASPKEVARLKAEQEVSKVFVDFVQTDAYKNSLQVKFAHWLADAQSKLSNLSSTPQELKEAQLQLHFVNEVQKTFTQHLERFIQNREKINEATGEK